MIFRLNPTALDKNYLAARPYQAVPISADFLKLIVNKPWGNEYLMYNSSAIEVWNLFISHNKATSMHCHPNKKTALVVLDGQALFSSLNESMELSPKDAVIIEPGVFHSTQAVSESGVKVLEFETPPMKHDLVRLEDKYGRTNEGYEGLEKMAPSGNNVRFTVNDIGITRNLCNSKMCLKSINNVDDFAALSGEKIVLAVILQGNIFSKYGDMLYSPADILRLEEFNNNNAFVYQNLQVLTIGAIE